MKIYSVKESKWKVDFIYSPLFEVICSLHVLVNHHHHLERLSWAENMMNRLPCKLREDIINVGKETSEWCKVMDFCNLYEECDDFNVMAAINFIEDLSLKDFDKELKEKVVCILKEYYHNYFEKELRYIEPLLIRCLKKDLEIYKREGVFNYVKELHSRIEVTEEAFLFHKFTLFTVPFNNLKRIIIRVSSFISPHLLMDYSEDTVQFTTTAHLDKGVNEVPIDLLRFTKALSDETRLKIIKKLYKGRCSTQSLAQELNLTEACVSKHLKILYNGELLYKEREGSYIFYYLNTSIIDKISMFLYDYLDC